MNSAVHRRPSTKRGTPPGAYGHGAIFELSKAGFSTLYSFRAQTSCTNGASPTALIQASDGNFHGETNASGPTNGYCGSGGCGVVFEITPSGTFTNLFGFGQHIGNLFTGYQPCCGLLQDTNGAF